ncbi:preprotein translocase subunit SecY [Telmatocola sphagniphila]|jgi:preprotein translocase subunit SecY|uniref:Protein translocase subunit SecY n=1 Tax=Telmatocola sphagniphila TaxID=1123043 RepID=A0A8E6B2Q9_9BACT|nr:preprotein translocase subunit SecY [Telmatocola sphagniphila]QVL30838.1 preprotein translocase subunit SecY [Telmatocola sphagniphila]
MGKLLTIFKIPELSRKIMITALFLIIYRIGYCIPLPMIDQVKLAQRAAESNSPLSQVLGFVSMFSGGNLSNACIFALGIMPYISASIILQLLSASGLSPYLEKLRKEPNGQKKINEYTRYLTVPITIIQAMLLVHSFVGGNAALFSPIEGYADGVNFYWFGFAAVTTMTAGTLFLMWLGEQIDEYGIGNGISLIIMAGIVARIPDAIRSLAWDSSKGGLKESLFTLGSPTGDVSFEKLILLMVLFVAVIVGVIAITKAQRRIPTQSAKHVRGRRVFGGTRQFLPLKVNQAGVMPVIFASSLLVIPSVFFNILKNAGVDWAGEMAQNFQRNSGWVYNICYVGMIYFFCYFWTAITFNPKEMAANLKDHGSFIQGYRPGRSTSEYLEKVLMRITYVGAAFLAVIAIIPTIISSELGVDYRIASFFGGTGLLIVVSVVLDLISKINSHLVMRNYPGLTED